MDVRLAWRASAPRLSRAGPFSATSRSPAPRPWRRRSGRWRRTCRAAAVRAIDGYGPLVPVRDETTGETLLQLPRAFRYLSTGWTGDPLDDGTRTPGAHDGMAAFSRDDRRVVLVRNHELTGSRSFAAGAPVYDTGAGGGTTTLRDRQSGPRV
jgi:secreted PhoX family phosphatase